MLDLSDPAHAPYAVAADAPAARRYAEPEHAYRGPFGRDRDRILHCAAFRRLADKTQVYTGDWGDYHRSRLTHTLEVAALSRSLARALHANEDLTEALALMHDLGHPPLGHAGEAVLAEAAASEGGFDHNRQALRIVETLEQRYPEFPGLNLCRETLAGQAYRATKRTEGGDSPRLEAQLVDAADSIAYDAHDADDAIEVGLIRYQELCETRLWREADAAVAERYGRLDEKVRRRAVVRALLDRLATDLLEETRRGLASAAPETPDDLQRLPVLARVSEATAQAKHELETFLFERVYRRPAVMETRQRGARRLSQLVERFRQNEHLLPAGFRRLDPTAGPLRIAIDYAASLTDRGFEAAWRRLFDPDDG